MNLRQIDDLEEAVNCLFNNTSGENNEYQVFMHKGVGGNDFTPVVVESLSGEELIDILERKALFKKDENNA
jgi:hypothetical protein